MSEQHRAPLAPPALSPEKERRLAVWAQLGGIVGFIPSLVIFLVFRERGKRIDSDVREALNWQLTLLIVWAALIVAVALINGPLLSSPLFAVGYIVGATPTILWLYNVFVSIHAARVVARGDTYRYPYTFRFLS